MISFPFNQRVLLRRIHGAVGLTALLFALQTQGQSVTYDFETGNDQGFGSGFGDDASATFNIVNIGGSQRMGVVKTVAFQEASRVTTNPLEAQYIAMNAASIDEANYRISYDWYIDTSLSGGNGSFLQLGVYVHILPSNYYAQDFPGAGKDVELNVVQLSSGNVFAGTVSETFSAKGFDLPAGQNEFRFGFIINGDGSPTVFFDNVRIEPVPEPATVALFAAALPALWIARRRSVRK